MMNNKSNTEAHIYNSASNKWISFIKRVGLFEFLMMLIRHFGASFILPGLKPRTFEFQGEKLNYFYAKYNITWVTERVLEVPIGRWYMQKAGPENTLEIGNVLSHYSTPTHAILDKFEKGPNVINEDVIDYKPDRTYDLIISISTFEHIGYEDDGNPSADKIVSAIEACKNLLSRNGKLVITVPFGYNPYMDAYIKSGKIEGDKTFYFEKSSNLEWHSTIKANAILRKYAKPYSYANAIMVAEFHRK